MPTAVFQAKAGQGQAVLGAWKYASLPSILRALWEVGVVITRLQRRRLRVRVVSLPQTQSHTAGM